MTRENNLNFSQRQGLSPLPTSYKLEDLSYDVRNEINYILDEEFIKYFGYYRGNEELPNWQKIFKDWHVKILKLPVGGFSSDRAKSILANLISGASYNTVLDTLEFLINHPILANHTLSNEISNLFEREQVAYLLIEKDKHIRFFVPRISNEEGLSYLKALDTLDIDSFNGARKALVEAGYYLGKRKYNDSVRESIHAVESVIKVLTEEKAIKYSDGLRNLGKKCSMHRALVEGFIKLYGFASDADGVRHSSVEGTMSIDKETAFYFLGSCSSFLTFLISKIRLVESNSEQSVNEQNDDKK